MEVIPLATRFPRYCKGARQTSLLCGGVLSRRNDRIGSRKGGSHARDDDRCSRFNFAQHCRYGPGPGPAVSGPNSASAGIGRHDNSAGAGWPSSADRALAAAFGAQGRGCQTATRSVGADSENLHELLRGARVIIVWPAWGAVFRQIFLFDDTVRQARICGNDVALLWRGALAGYQTLYLDCANWAFSLL